MRPARLAGFLRNLRRVHRRAGGRGVAELLAARALPRALSYQRATITVVPARGRIDPELDARVVRSLDPEVERFHVALGRSGEPEVPVFSPADLRERFASGHELWLFYRDGAIAHSRWIVRDRLMVAGVPVPLLPGETATEGVVTVPGLRTRGLNAAAREHVRGVLEAEGVTAVLGSYSGFNRWFIDSSLRRVAGMQRVATVHVVSVLGRRLLRAVPASASGADLLRRRGLATDGWTRVIDGRIRSGREAADRPSRASAGMRRASGFLRTLRRVHRRVGAAGVIELVVERALPNVLSYGRAVIVATQLTAMPGAERPPRADLRARRVRSSDPAIDAFFARLAAMGEPEVPSFSGHELERRFAAGQELWVFELDGRIAHARWIVPGHRRYPGGSLPLRDDERASEAVVTAPEFRGHGVAWAAREHIATVLREEGVSTVYSAPSGFNRGFLAATLRTGGARHVATVHLVSVGRRRWLRTTPRSSEQAELLDARGVPHGRWVAAGDG